MFLAKEKDPAQRKPLPDIETSYEACFLTQHDASRRFVSRHGGF
jgi:hypothetical protein